MKLRKLLMVYSIFALALIVASCEKEDFKSRDTSGLVPDPEIPEPIDPIIVVLDNCDKLDDWEISGGTGFLETIEKKEGEAAIEGHFKATEDYLHFIKRLSTPVNSNLTAETAQLSFWLYLEKPIAVKEGQIEITSSGAADQQEFHWDIPTLKTGWNEIKLNVSDAVAENGGADLSAVNWFRMYIITDGKVTEDVKVRLDYVKFSAVSAGPVIPQNFVSFLNCDVFDEELWEISGGTGRVETTNKKEGAGALFGTTHPTNGYLHFKLKKALVPAINTNLTAATAQLSFWLFVGKATTLGGQIEISSSGEPDQQEYNWDPAKIAGLKPNSWNLVKLNIRDANVSNGPVDLSAINFFRMYLETGEDDIDVGIDDIKFGAIPPPEPSLFESCDTDAGWEISNGTGSVETQNKKEGTGYIQGAIGSGDGYIHFIKKREATPFDTGVTKENGQLTFWLYLERAIPITDGQIEITSSGQSDQQEYHWDVPPLAGGLKAGWNEMKLDISDAVEDNGPVDLSKLNLFRIYFRTDDATTAGVKIGLDGIRFQQK